MVWVTKGLLYPLIARNSSLNLKNKITLIKTLIQPQLAYVSAAWGYAVASQDKKIQAVENTTTKEGVRTKEEARTKKEEARTKKEEARMKKEARSKKEEARTKEEETRHMTNPKPKASWPRTKEKEEARTKEEETRHMTNPKAKASWARTKKKQEARTKEEEARQMTNPKPKTFWPRNHSVKTHPTLAQTYLVNRLDGDVHP